MTTTTKATKKKRRRSFRLTQEEGLALFDGEARRLFGMSGPEWLAKYDAGEIDVDDPRIHNAAIRMEFLIPFVRTVRSRS